MSNIGRNLQRWLGRRLAATLPEHVGRALVVEMCERERERQTAIGAVARYVKAQATDLDRMEWDLPPDGDLAFEHFAGLFSSTTLDESIISMNVRQAAYLFGLVRRMDPSRVIEIGRYKGGTTALIAAAMRGRGRFWSIDIAALDPHLRPKTVRPVEIQIADLCQRFGLSVDLIVGDPARSRSTPAKSTSSSSTAITRTKAPGATSSASAAASASAAPSSSTTPSTTASSTSSTHRASAPSSTRSSPRATIVSSAPSSAWPTSSASGEPATRMTTAVRRRSLSRAAEILIAAERGVLGLAAWLSIWVAFFVQAGRIYARLPTARTGDRALVAGSLAAVTGFLVAGRAWPSRSPDSAHRGGSLASARRAVAGSFSPCRTPAPAASWGSSCRGVRE